MKPGYLLTWTAASLLGFQALVGMAGQTQEINYKNPRVQALAKKLKEGSYKTSEATCMMMNRSGVNAECSFDQKGLRVRMQGRYREDGNFDLLAVTYTDPKSGKETRDSYVVQKTCGATPGTPKCDTPNSDQAKKDGANFNRIAGETFEEGNWVPSPSPPGDLKREVK